MPSMRQWPGQRDRALMMLSRIKLQRPAENSCKTPHSKRTNNQTSIGPHLSNEGRHHRDSLVRAHKSRWAWFTCTTPCATCLWTLPVALLVNSVAPAFVSTVSQAPDRPASSDCRTPCIQTARGLDTLSCQGLDEHRFSRPRACPDIIQDDTLDHSSKPLLLRAAPPPSSMSERSLNVPRTMHYLNHRSTKRSAHGLRTRQTTSRSNLATIAGVRFVVT